MKFYFKRPWNETTGDPLTDSWGTATYFFETDLNGNVLRQLEVYEKGRRLKYAPDYSQDDYGGLSEVPLNLEEFKEFEITKREFEDKWRQ
jgi:hypothetical protein